MSQLYLALAARSLAAGSLCLLVACATTPNRYSSGTIPTRSGAEIQQLRELLGEDPCRWNTVLQEYFRDVYDPSKPDLVVYIPKEGNARQGLIQNGTCRSQLKGERALWVLVFSESLFSPADSNDLRASLTSLDYKVDKFLVALVKSLSKSLLGGAPEPQATGGQDTSVAFRLKPLNRTGASDRLYVGMTRIPIGPDTRNRVSIRPTAVPAFPGDVSVHHTFGNVSDSPFGVSLAAGLTFNADKREFKGGEELVGPDIRSSFYLFGNYRLIPPGEPWNRWRRQSLGIALGTNLFNGQLLDDVVAGVSLEGLLAGDVGLIVGVNGFVNAEKEDTTRPVIEESRKWRFFLGLAFGL